VRYPEGPDRSVPRWLNFKDNETADASSVAVLDKLVARLAARTSPRLYDIGAGDGRFLSMARDRGFAVGGNEIMEAAVRLAGERYDINLDYGDLTRIEVDGQYDAVTLLCVIAHITHHDALLRSCFGLLNSGGVIYLQTPRLCAVDRASLAVMQLTGGAMSRWIDRRIAAHHWLLHTKKSLTLTLEKAGFVDVEVQASARYSLTAASYLSSLGVKESASERVGAYVDRLLARGLAPRIVFDAFARKP